MMLHKLRIALAAILVALVAVSAVDSASAAFGYADFKTRSVPSSISASVGCHLLTWTLRRAEPITAASPHPDEDRGF
jgi:hypothetical protein